MTTPTSTTPEPVTVCIVQKRQMYEGTWIVGVFTGPEAREKARELVEGLRNKNTESDIEYTITPWTGVDELVEGEEF
jgi:hypothetical protein